MAFLKDLYATKSSRNYIFVLNGTEFSKLSNEMNLFPDFYTFKGNECI